MALPRDKERTRARLVKLVTQMRPVCFIALLRGSAQSPLLLHLLSGRLGVDRSEIVQPGPRATGWNLEIRAGHPETSHKFPSFRHVSPRGLEIRLNSV